MVRIEQGMVRLTRRHTELLRELTQYPHGAHDDGIDALSMLVDLAEEISSMNIDIMLKVFKKMNSPDIQNPRQIMSVGGRPFDDPFRMFSV